MFCVEPGGNRYRLRHGEPRAAGVPLGRRAGGRRETVTPPPRAAWRSEHELWVRGRLPAARAGRAAGTHALVGAGSCVYFYARRSSMNEPPPRPCLCKRRTTLRLLRSARAEGLTAWGSALHPRGRAEGRPTCFLPCERGRQAPRAGWCRLGPRCVVTSAPNARARRPIHCCHFGHASRAAVLFCI